MKESSKEKALDTARALFTEKGKDGVKMQEIADKAGINKGLLHYYFKSKDELFLEIFLNEVHLIYADINKILKSEISLDEKLAAIIDQYFNLLSEKPNLPTFVMFEINKNPQLASKLANEANLQETVQLLDAEFKANKITSTPEFAFQVILNIISLCVFPFAMRPLVQEMGKRNGSDWTQLMDSRKDFLKRLIINSFKP